MKWILIFLLESRGSASPIPRELMNLQIDAIYNCPSGFTKTPRKSKAVSSYAYVNEDNIEDDEGIFAWFYIN